MKDASPLQQLSDEIRLLFYMGVKQPPWEHIPGVARTQALSPFRCSGRAGWGTFSDYELYFRDLLFFLSL
jgi:hypothetical protein